MSLMTVPRLLKAKSMEELEVKMLELTPRLNFHFREISQLKNGNCIAWYDVLRVDQMRLLTQEGRIKINKPTQTKKTIKEKVDIL